MNEAQNAFVNSNLLNWEHTNLLMRIFFPKSQKYARKYSRLFLWLLFRRIWFASRLILNFTDPKMCYHNHYFVWNFEISFRPVFTLSWSFKSTPSPMWTSFGTVQMCGYSNTIEFIFFFIHFEEIASFIKFRVKYVNMQSHKWQLLEPV